MIIYESGPWSIKNSAWEPFAMPVNMSGCVIAQTTPHEEGMNSFDLSHEDTQDENNWRLRIKGTTG